MPISLIIPAYNAERFIGEAIQSVLNQERPDWELIIINDGSTDRTEAVVKSFHDSRIHLICFPNSSGPAKARQAGTKIARYEFVYYLDADDRLCPRALNVLEKAFIKTPHAVAVYASYVRIDTKGHRYGKWRRILPCIRPSGNVLEAQLKSNILTTGSALFRRTAVLESNCWKEGLRNAEDWVAWSLLATMGAFVFIPNFIAFEYREISTGLSQSKSVSFDNFRPSLDAVFCNPVVMERFSNNKLKNLRIQQEAHLLTYIAMLNLRKKDWRSFNSNLIKAMVKAPLRAPINLLRCLFAFVDTIL